MTKNIAPNMKKQIDISKEAFVSLLQRIDKEIDICEYDEYPHGIGYNELRYVGLDDYSNPYFESNNVHDWDRGDDEYMKFKWEELTTYERESVCHFISSIVLAI